MEVLVEKATGLAGHAAGLARVVRSVFEFVSAGVLLPGGLGLPDPCVEYADLSQLKDDKERNVELKRVDLAADLSNDQRDQLTRRSQEALRAIAFGRWNEVLG